MVDVWSASERSRMSTHELTSSQNAMCSKPAGSKSAPSSRLRTWRTFLLNSAVTPGGVVVSGLEPGALLDQVGPEQEAVLRVHQRRDPGEERAADVGMEVADRAAEEGDQAAGLARDPLEVGLVVAHDPVHPQPAYSSTSRSAVSRVISSEMSTGTYASSDPASRIASSRRRVFAAEPDPSSISIEVAGGGDDLAAPGRRGSPARRASGSTRAAR